MLTHQACEDIIASVQSFAKAVAAAKSVYADLPKLIEDEHKIIRARDLGAMEKITERKLEVGRDLEKAINATMDAVFAVRDACNNCSIDVPKFEPQLSSALAIFKGLNIEIEKVDSFKSQIFHRVLKTCENQLEDFYQSVELTRGRIEVNKRLTSELLRHHQESIRFWQNVAMEAEATYTAGGVRKRDHNAGILKVGA